MSKNKDDNNYHEWVFDNEKPKHWSNGRGKYGDVYTRCIACNRSLLPFQMSKGLCGECFTVVINSSKPHNHENDMYYVEYEMWRNPMGSFDQEYGLDDVDNEEY